MNLQEEKRVKAIAQKRAESKEMIKISLSDLVELITINRRELHRGNKYTGVILIGELPQPDAPITADKLVEEPFQKVTLSRDEGKFNVTALASPCCELGWIGVEKDQTEIWFYDNQIYRLA